MRDAVCPPVLPLLHWLFRPFATPRLCIRGRIRREKGRPLLPLAHHGVTINLLGGRLCAVAGCPSSPGGPSQVEGVVKRPQNSTFSPRRSRRHDWVPDARLGRCGLISEGWRENKVLR